MLDIHVERAQFLKDTHSLRGTVNVDGLIKLFEVPESELCYRKINWELFHKSSPLSLVSILEGFDAKIIEENSQKLILSIRQKQLEQIENIKVGDVFYDCKIVKLNYDTIFCELQNGIIASVLQKEITTANVGDVRDLFKVGDSINVKIIDIVEREDGFHFHASRKQCYYSLAESVEKKLIKTGIVCEGMITNRLNSDGAWVELTPGVTGILNAEPEELDVLSIGQRISVIVGAYKPGKGFKLYLQ